MVEIIKLKNKKSLYVLNNALFFLGLFGFLLFNHFGRSHILNNEDSFYMGVYSSFFFYMFVGGYINQCKGCGKIQNRFIPDNFLGQGRFLEDLLLLITLGSALILFLIGPFSGLGYPGLELFPYGLSAKIFTFFFFSCLFFALIRLIVCDRKISLRVITLLIFNFGITMIFLSIRSKEFIFLWKLDTKLTPAGCLIVAAALVFL